MPRIEACPDARVQQLVDARPGELHGQLALAKDGEDFVPDPERI
jgi:hypothetical protein